MCSQERIVPVFSKEKEKLPLWIAPLKKLEKSPRFHKCFQQLGDDWIVNTYVLKEMKKFTLKKLKFSIAKHMLYIYITNVKVLLPVVHHNFLIKMFQKRGQNIIFVCFLVLALAIAIFIIIGYR